jgi:hypothetical protein
LSIIIDLIIPGLFALSQELVLNGFGDSIKKNRRERAKIAFDEYEHPAKKTLATDAAQNKLSAV